MISKLDSAGCSRYIVTDVTKDGTLTGPNLGLLREVCSATSAPVIASGGISELQDLIDLRAMTNLGVEGAIVGKAIYSGAFSLAQALEVAVK
jgi:phosphoribosylformimino-5-aminoimidazole carboxamide ribonucleotide (ProFAR) isomerase